LHTPQNRIIVIKLGTAVLTNKNGTLNTTRIRQIVDEIAKNRKKVKAFIIVTSGAIASGITRLGIRSTPESLPLTMKQVCAAVGQPWLMNTYSKLFRRHGITIAQVLLTEDDLANRYSYLNFWRTLKTLLEKNVVPIINENDAITVKELIPVNPYVPDTIRFGDNDKLSALIASRIRASKLIILTNVDGFFSTDRNGKLALVRRIARVDKATLRSARGADKLGRGGMMTKLEAARIASRSGVATVIANGGKKNMIERILAGEAVGTLIVPLKRK
jgi:glutamate 5-kinase